jgi:hypothetical protein
MTVTSFTCVRKSKTDTSLCGNLMTTEHNWTGAPRSRALLSRELFGIDARDVEASKNCEAGLADESSKRNPERENLLIVQHLLGATLTPL